ASLPPWYRSLYVGRASHPCLHVANAHELERSPGEHESIARPEPRNERFLDRAQVGAPQILHGDMPVAHNGSDCLTMPSGEKAALDDPAAIAHDDARVLRIGVQ